MTRNSPHARRRPDTYASVHRTGVPRAARPWVTHLRGGGSGVRRRIRAWWRSGPSTMVVERGRLLRLLPGGGPGVLAGLIGCHLVVAVLPVLTAAVVGRLVAAITGPGGPATTLLFAVAAAGLLFLGQFGGALGDLLRRALAQRIDGRLREAVRRLATAPTGI